MECHVPGHSPLPECVCSETVCHVWCLCRRERGREVKVLLDKSEKLWLTQWAKRAEYISHTLYPILLNSSSIYKCVYGKANQSVAILWCAFELSIKPSSLGYPLGTVKTRYWHWHVAILAQQQPSDNCDKASFQRGRFKLCPRVISIVGARVCVRGVSLQSSLGKRKLFAPLCLSLGVCVSVALKLLGFSRTENVVKSIKRAATWPEQSSINFLNAAAKR